MIYVLGGHGFVGSAYPRLFDRQGIPYRIVTRDNYATLRGTSCDVFINANGNSRKYLADREPLTDFDMSVRSIADSLQSFRCGTYVLLSSGDVYPDTTSPATTREDQAIDTRRTSRYGLHKLLAETLVRGVHPRPLVIRMGGFVGPGLKKNAIFDMLTGGDVWLAPDSRLQFISTDRAAALVWDMATSGVHDRVVNIGGRGLVHLGTLHRHIGSTSRFKADAPTIRYELALDTLESVAHETLPASVDEVEAFVASWLPAVSEAS
jgi:nucleoside-diphosphate-sugar epimerase